MQILASFGSKEPSLLMDFSSVQISLSGPLSKYFSLQLSPEPPRQAVNAINKCSPMINKQAVNVRNGTIDLRPAFCAPVLFVNTFLHFNLLFSISLCLLDVCAEKHHRFSLSSISFNEIRCWLFNRACCNSSAVSHCDVVGRFAAGP